MKDRTTLRPLQPPDVRRIIDICRATGVFRDDELEIALEVATEAGARPGAAGTGPSDPSVPYHALVAEVDGDVAGWICWGATPCTVGTWDLYWMAVDPARHGAGVGTRLIEAMERRLDGVARLIVIDTSGRADYGPTRAFYEARGYEKAATVRDFYANGDDQVIYSKRVGTPWPQSGASRTGSGS